LKLKAILILMAILAVAGITAYFVSQHKPPTTPPADKHFVWDFDMDKLQKVTLSIPGTQKSESFKKNPDDREFYFDFNGTQGPMVDNQRWGGGIPLLLSGPMADRLIKLQATPDDLSLYGLNTSDPKEILTLDALLTITLNGQDLVYDVQVGDSNPEGTTYYVKLASNSDVYTVDQSWYVELAKIVNDPPYVPAKFVVDVPTVSSAQVAINETETISVNVTNNGDVKGSGAITLWINGELVNTKSIALDARANQVVTFDVQEPAAGKYTASINQAHNVTFTVK
jgi:hypothetical protein